MTASFETLLGLDGRLTRAGHHPLTGFWREQLERFYAHPNATTLVAQVGRGGAKSHTSAKVALNETLFGERVIPPGERHFWAFVSKNKDEAGQRLTLLQKFLRDLGVGFDVAGDEIALRDLRVGFRVFACQIGAVSGFRCFGYSADELAKYVVAGVHTAQEICTSLNAMCVTHPGARKLLISSPAGTTTYHHERYQRGETNDQITAYAPSWVANPDAITEEQTRQAEPHDGMWTREYLAVAVDGIEDNWFGDAAIERAIDREELQEFARSCIDKSTRYTIAIDPKFSAKTQDRFGGAVVSSTFDSTSNAETLGARVTRVHETFAWRADRSPKLMAERLRTEVLDRYGHTGKVFTDQYEGYSFQELAKSAGVALEVVPWTAGDAEGSKLARFRAVRLAMIEGALRIPNDQELLRELRSVRGVLTPSGHERIEVPRSAQGHGDRVSALVLAASIALAKPPKLAPSQWTLSDYLARSEAFDRFCVASGAMFFHPIFNGKFGCLSFEEMHRLIEKGLLRI